MGEMRLLLHQFQAIRSKKGEGALRWFLHRHKLPRRQKFLRLHKKRSSLQAVAALFGEMTMPYEVGECTGTQRDGTVMLYFFQVTNGQASHDVAVGITDQAMHPTGQTARTAELLMPAAKAWLEHNLARNLDPANQRPPLLDAMMLDFWVSHGAFPA